MDNYRQQVEIDKLDFPGLQDDLIPKCSFCLGRLFNQIAVIGPCGHVYHEFWYKPNPNPNL
jgi:hypothetical protein